MCHLLTALIVPTCARCDSFSERETNELFDDHIRFLSNEVKLLLLLFCHCLSPKLWVILVERRLKRSSYSRPGKLSDSLKYCFSLSVNEILPKLLILLQNCLAHLSALQNYKLCLGNEQGVLQMDSTYSSHSSSLFSHSLFSLSLALLSVSTGTKGSELFYCEDCRHTDQCQQSQTWHYICLPHPPFLHAGSLVIPVLLLALILCLLFLLNFFLLFFVVLLFILLLLLLFLSAANRLRSVQRPPGAADTWRVWVTILRLLPLLFLTFSRFSTFPLLNTASQAGIGGLCRHLASSHNEACC